VTQLRVVGHDLTLKVKCVTCY